jgi:hypothetical protein
MPRTEEYRNNATQSFVLARHASSFDEKARLLELAERWLDLADRIANSNGPRHTGSGRIPELTVRQLSRPARWKER